MEERHPETPPFYVCVHAGKFYISAGVERSLALAYHRAGFAFPKLTNSEVMPGERVCQYISLEEENHLHIVCTTYLQSCVFFIADQVRARSKVRNLAKMPLGELPMRDWPEKRARLIWHIVLNRRLFKTDEVGPLIEVKQVYPDTNVELDEPFNDDVASDLVLDVQVLRRAEGLRGWRIWTESSHQPVIDTVAERLEPALRRYLR